MPEISDIVRVTAQIAAQGVLRREFGTTLFVYESTVGDSTDEAVIRGARARDLRVNFYSSASAVNDEYVDGTEARAAAAIYFQQVPFPKNFATAAVFPTGAPTYVLGVAANTGSLATIIGLGTSQIIVAGQTLDVDFAVTGTGATGFNAVATRLQAQISGITNPDLSAVTVNWSTDHFVVTVPNGAAINGITGPAATALGFGGDTYFEGVDDEFTSEGLERILGLNNQWYWLTAAPSIWSDRTKALDIAAWAATQEISLILESDDPTVLNANETSSIPAALFALEYDRTSVIWSRTRDYKSVSYAGRFSSVNFSQSNSIITGKFQDLPGTTPDEITLTQKRELDRKRLNHYSPYGADSITAEGVTLRSGTFIDVRYFLDWLINAVQTNVYNLLRQSPTRIPQTRDGIAAINNTITSVMEEAVRNGGIAPGQLTEALRSDVARTTGAQDFDGALTLGYLIHIDSLATQPQSDRAQRIAPPVRIWIKGAGAIHFVNISITFEN